MNSSTITKQWWEDKPAKIAAGFHGPDPCMTSLSPMINTDALLKISALAGATLAVAMLILTIRVSS